MRTVTVDEALDQVRELINWVESVNQDVLIVRDGRVIAEFWPADDMWDWMNVLPDPVTGQRDQPASAGEWERSW